MSEFYTPIQIEWTPDYPVWLLPDELKELFIIEASLLLKELNERFLDVKLIPAPEQRHHDHKIRTVENTNCDWFLSLQAISSNAYRRLRVKDYLNKIITGDDKMFYSVHTGLRKLILNRLLEGYSQEGCDVPPDDTICNAFFESKR